MEPTHTDNEDVAGLDEQTGSTNHNEMSVKGVIVNDTHYSDDYIRDLLEYALRINYKS